MNASGVLPVTAQELWLDGGQHVEIREAALPEPSPGQVLVQTEASAISAGTELLFYRGAVCRSVPVDISLNGYRAEVSYPMRYGYASVGVVRATGPGVDAGLQGRLVFSFSPHASAFIASAAEVHPVPPGLGPEDAAFLANMETAVTLLLDGQPRLQDRVSVFGLGVVGLCATALLARFPLARLRAYDPIGLRRAAAAALGAEAREPPAPETMTEDLVFELTGSPDALGPAVAAAAYSGLVVIGSWYGARSIAAGLPADAPGLGGGLGAGLGAPGPDAGPGATDAAAFSALFHRNRVRVLASQVSTIDPALTGRWNAERRLEAAWEAIRTVRPSKWITHRVPFSRAAEAYAMLAGRRCDAIQVLLVRDPSA